MEIKPVAWMVYGDSVYVDKAFCRKESAELSVQERKDGAKIDALYDQASINALLALLAAKKARIDELMLEYCPDEMTPEQRAEWARHQRAVTT